MRKLIKNDWHRENEEPYIRAKILNHETHPEGLNVDRIRFISYGCLIPRSNVGHIISVLRGNGRLYLACNNVKYLRLKAGIHFYLPPGLVSKIDAEKGTEFLRVSSPSPDQTRGKQLLFRDEKFLSACASRFQSFRWILTPQYLSRRIFLHHDPILLSKTGNPISWFRTTMFDVTGLPTNEDGEPVFKMSYNSRTEFNVCYEIKGTARVRMAQHPYEEENQLWGSWLQLDEESTYLLNEASGGPEEEDRFDGTTQTSYFLRNKHEVHIVDGHVTLFCLFDPAPTGNERHQPGEYSDYEPLSKLLGTKLYEDFQQEIKRYDVMVDSLSLAKAMGELSTFHGTPIWELFLQGREAQSANEKKLARILTLEGNGRDQILENWFQP